MSHDTRRLFFALWPSPHIVSRLQALQAGLDGRLTHPQDFHLTLAFLGDQPASVLAVLQQVLSRLPHLAVPMLLDTPGYFPGPRVAWVGPGQVPDRLASLRAAVVEELAKVELVWPDRASFRPHVTLARSSQRAPAPFAQSIAWTAHQCVLAHSRPAADGAKYEIVQSITLKG